MKLGKRWWQAAAAVVVGICCTGPNAQAQEPAPTLTLDFQPVESGTATETSENAFATFTADELLQPNSQTSPAVRQAGTTAPPAPIGRNVASTTLNASPSPTGPSPLVQAGGLSIGDHLSHGVGGGGGGCAACGGAGGAGGAPSYFVDNMVFTYGASYFRQSGGINDEIVRFQTSRPTRNIPLLGGIPNPDDERLGGFVSMNGAMPLVGGLNMQLGVNYNQAEQGGQTFYTFGFFKRCNPLGGLNVNMGAVYDGLYDTFSGIHVGQVRFQVGSAFTPNNEIGFWLNLATNTDDQGLDIRSNDGTGGVRIDQIFTHFKPVGQGYLFWRHIFDIGAEFTLQVGVRGDPDAFVYGGTASYPLTDHWALVFGGQGSDDDETFNIYTGVSLFPGGRARVANACGDRLLPYLPVADNNYLNAHSKQRFFRAQGFSDIPL